jgi:SAM-dependent methyltransferase
VKYSNQNNILTEVATYYSDKLNTYGQTPQGVDWNGEESQFLRFTQLCKIINTSSDFSINDLGCGYGALYDFLCQKFKGFSYSGIDVSQDMIDAAQHSHQLSENSRFVVASQPDEIADFGIASGIFNVRLGRSNSEWAEYLEATLDVLDRTSRFGFAFNCLTSYSDEGKMRDYLYYANPGDVFDLCKKRYSKNIALLHDYDLYEFTILIRKL